MDGGWKGNGVVLVAFVCSSATHEGIQGIIVVCLGAGNSYHPPSEVVVVE